MAAYFPLLFHLAAEPASLQRSSAMGFRSAEGTLFGEGYLTKTQSFFEGLDRKRWFTLTAQEFA